MLIKVAVQGLLSTNCYMFSDSKNAYIVDCAESAQELIDAVESQGLIPRGIILTHFHLDHIKGIREAGKLPVYISQKDLDIILKDDVLSIMANDFYPENYIGDAELKLLEEYFRGDNIRAIGEGFSFPNIKLNTSVISTPGHTPGGICVLVEGKDGDKALFSGDTLFFQSHGRVDLPFSNASDMRESLKKLSSLDDSIKVYPGHGAFTSIKNEKLQGYLK